MSLTDPLGLSALPALVPALGTAGTGLILIQGGAGTAAISGAVVETGSIGGPAGVAVAGAAIAGWGTGRMIAGLPNPLVNGMTIGDGVTVIGNLTLFRPDPDPLPGATPLLKRLAGRNCKQKEFERDVCKDIYAEEVARCEMYIGTPYYTTCLEIAVDNYIKCRNYTGPDDPGPDPIGPPTPPN